MTSTVTSTSRMDDLQWPRIVNKVITEKWSQLKNTLVMKDFVDHLIQKRVVTLDYWMSLKSKPISESERTEDFLSLVMKFDQQKYNHFLEALLAIQRKDLVKSLMKAQNLKPKQSVTTFGSEVKDKKKEGQTDADQLPKSPLVAQPKSKLDVSQSTKLKFDGGQSANVKSNTVVKPTKPVAMAVQQAEASVKLHQGIGNEKSDLNKMAKEKENKQKDDMKQGKDERSKATANQEKPDGADSKVISEAQAAPDKPSSTANKPETQSSTPNKQSKPGTPNKQSKPGTPNKQGKPSTPNKPGTPNNPESKKSAASPGKEIASDKKERPDTGKNREELLHLREQQIKDKELKLEQKEKELQEHEKSLKLKETELMTRENTLLSQTRDQDNVPLPLPKYLRDQLAPESPGTASTTQSSELYVELSEQLAALKKAQKDKEIESEHSTTYGSPKEEYVKLQDFQTAQQDIEDIKEEIATDRDKRESMQEKIESLKHEVESLNRTIKMLETEKENDKQELEREMNRMKTEMKNTKLHSNEKINSLRKDMKAKEEQCEQLHKNIAEIVQDADELDKRVEALETDKDKYERELQKYEKEVCQLKDLLDLKEGKIKDLHSLLEETENEKEDLIEEITELKTEMTKLKSDKKRLEQEKKQLLGRCVKPQWNSSSRKPSMM